MHAEGGFPPMLFDRQVDPEEFFDVGRDPDYQEIVKECYSRLHEWAMRSSQRTTLSAEELTERRGKSRRKGIVLGVVDDDTVDEELFVKYQGPARQNHLT